ncbi:MAG: ribonuclease HII [Anaerorhabdus sp.]
MENKFENIYWEENTEIIGIDEAGRGPLAGPLVVAGVKFKVGYKNDLINDSKKISEKKRNELFDIIIRDASEYYWEIVSTEVIDKENIYRATQNAMGRVADKLSSNVVLTDAMPLLNSKKTVMPIVKGDQKSISISAASILAKVIRDRCMIEYDKQYPKYGFAKHKGYPTKQHLQALKNEGVLEIHRKTYRPVAELLKK